MASESRDEGVYAWLRKGAGQTILCVCLLYTSLLKYAKVYTTSDPESGTHPSAAREFDLAHLLVEEMKSIGIEDAFVDEHCYVYGSIPATKGLSLIHISL